MEEFSKTKQEGTGEEPNSNPPNNSMGDFQEQNTYQNEQPPQEPAGEMYNGPKSTKESEEKISRIQKQTDEVTQVMKGNVDQMLTRGESMQDLTKQTETLQTSSQVFAENAAAVKKKLWWKNVKTGIIVAAIILLIIIAIVVYFVISSKNKHKKQ
jgi:t-SNARE complex subunit (syntaxin)